MLYSSSVTEQIPNQRRNPMDWSRIPQYMMGPTQRFYMKRALSIYTAFAVIGILPTFLARFCDFSISFRIQAAGWGLLFPGAGFIAVGTLSATIFGILLFLCSITLGASLNSMLGMLGFSVYLWILNVIGSFFMAKDAPPMYACMLNLIILCMYLIKTFGSAVKVQKQRLTKYKKNKDAYPEEVAELRANRQEATNPECRELSEDAIKAVRFLFDMSLNRDPGEMTGYETAEQFQLSAYRYSLDYIGYAFATMQCFCTPNFHGYLNKAQQYVIDSLTTPEICSYWKYENFWGNFRFDADPIRYHNIMLSGWSGILPVLYTGNSGDDRYEKENSLNFRPFKKHLEKSYPYHNESLVKAIVHQWDTLRSKLIPCEPNQVFPWCNAWGFNTVLAYDRIHGTSYLADHYNELEKALYEEFTNSDGKLAVLKNTMFGSLPNNPGAFLEQNSSFAVSRIFNPIDPALAEKEYILGKKDSFIITADDVDSKIGPLDEQVDMNFKKGPGTMLGTSAVAAREMGDYDFAEALLKKADKLMERVDDSKKLYYKKASVTANASLALARFAQTDDLYHMIHHGPGTAALSGPVLEQCNYPEVLVAKARSHKGTDLELVLYDGIEPGVFNLGLTRLTPDSSYWITETGEHFQANTNGCANIKVYINGRTVITIERE